MGFLNIIWVWLKQLIMLPANLAKVASINKYLELQKELFEAQKRLEKAEQRLAKDAAIKTGRMFFFNNVFWAKDENGQIEESPYCPRCFELDGKAVHLIIWYRPASKSNVAKCPECKVDDILFRIPD
jgi:hypothetical protein